MLWWNVDPKDKPCPLSDFWAIICNLLVKLKTVLDNEFCLHPETCVMGSADAAFVTTAPQLVVFWVSASFSATQSELWTSVISRWQCLLSTGYTVIVTDHRQEEFAWADCIYVRLCMRALCENYSSKEIGYWCDFSVCSKIMFDKSTKGQ